MQRIPEIDGLRAVAVGLVLLGHSLAEFFPGAGVGVDLFFVISGFVITRSLMAEPDLKLFYLKRVRRILPALLVACLGALLLGAARFDVMAAALSFMNWARAFGYTEGGMMGHAWSLSIEEQFYLLWPALFLFLKRPVPFLIGWVAVVFLLRMGFDDTYRIFNGLDTHSDGLALGCLLAYLGNALPKWSWPIPAAIIAGLSLTVQPVEFALGAASLMSFCLVSIASEHRFELLRSSLFQWAGTRSYSLYLWHFPLFKVVFAQEWRLMVAAPLAVGISLIAAEMSYRYVERPFLRRNRAKRLPGAGGATSDTNPADAPAGSRPGVEHNLSLRVNARRRRR